MEESEKKSYAAVMAETPTDQSAPRTPVTFKITFLIADNSLQRSLRQEALCWQDTNPDVTLELRKVLGAAGQPEQAVLCAKRNILLSQDVQDALAELAGGKLPMGTNLEMAKNAIDASGRLKPGVAAPLAALPDFLQQFCKAIHSELYESAQSWAELLRWRLGLTGGQPQALNFKGLDFTVDEKSWHPLALFITLKIMFGIAEPGSGVTAEIINPVAELRKQNESEPISRAMFREAWNLQQGNLRSALMIGYAAVETGCKEFIGKLVPDAKWLAMEAPTPPLPSILKNYLPTLPVRLKIGGQVIIPRRIRRAVEEAMQARNTLAHSGALELSRGELENILRCFNDLLWLLDVYAGHSWASQHLSPQTATEIFPSPTIGQSVA